MNVGTAIKTGLYSAKEFFVKNKGIILSVTGNTLCLGGFVLGVRAGTKIESELKRRKELIDGFKHIYDTYEADNDNDAYTEKELKRDIFRTNRKCGFEVGKRIIIPTAMEFAGIVFNTMSYKTEHNNFVKASEAVLAISAAFAGYRTNVVNELGADMDQHFLYGTSAKEKTVTVVSKDEDGNEVETKEKLKTLENLYGVSPFAVVWSPETTNRYQADESYTDDFFYNTAHYLEDTLTICGRYDLNYVLRYLGVKEKYLTLNGQAWGWRKGDKVEIKRIKVARPIGNGKFEKVSIVDFNCRYILGDYPDKTFNDFEYMLDPSSIPTDNPDVEIV